MFDRLKSQQKRRGLAALWGRGRSRSRNQRRSKSRSKSRDKRKRSRSRPLRLRRSNSTPVMAPAGSRGRVVASPPPSSPYPHHRSSSLPRRRRPRSLSRSRSNTRTNRPRNRPNGLARSQSALHSHDQPTRKDVQLYSYPEDTGGTLNTSHRSAATRDTFSRDTSFDSHFFSRYSVQVFDDSASEVVNSRSFDMWESNEPPETPPRRRSTPWHQMAHQHSKKSFADSLTATPASKSPHVTPRSQSSNRFSVSDIVLPSPPSMHNSYKNNSNNGILHYGATPKTGMHTRSRSLDHNLFCGGKQQQERRHSPHTVLDGPGLVSPRTELWNDSINLFSHLPPTPKYYSSPTHSARNLLPEMDCVVETASVQPEHQHCPPQLQYYSKYNCLPLEDGDDGATRTTFDASTTINGTSTAYDRRDFSLWGELQDVFLDCTYMLWGCGAKTSCPTCGSCYQEDDLCGGEGKEDSSVEPTTVAGASLMS